MAGLSFPGGPVWPPDLNSYAYLQVLTYPQFAWEILRRCPDYRRAVRLAGPVKCWRLPDAPQVLMSRDRCVMPAARAFELISFRLA